MKEFTSPLVGPPPTEVPLPKAPLLRVIGQVRFPLIASIETQHFIGGFQEAIRSEYPVLRTEQSRGVIFGPEKVVEARMNSIWRFHDAQEDWRISLAPDFLAIETTRYNSRKDFLSRFERVLNALKNHINPAVIDRLGVRYIDRVTGPPLDSIVDLVRPEVVGILATDIASAAVHSVTECLFELPDEEAFLKARWGIVPPNATVDPAAIEPIEERSWLLDLDAFRSAKRDLNVAAVLCETKAFTEVTVQSPG